MAWQRFISGGGRYSRTRSPVRVVGGLAAGAARRRLKVSCVLRAKHHILLYRSLNYRMVAQIFLLTASHYPTSKACCGRHICHSWYAAFRAGTHCFAIFLAGWFLLLFGATLRRFGVLLACKLVRRVLAIFWAATAVHYSSCCAGRWHSDCW